MDTLPNEILLQIFSYLPTFDLIQFCKVYEKYEYFFGEKNIVQYINFNKNVALYNFDLCKFLNSKVPYDFIKVLNINCIYWIPAKDLRNCIKKLSNLSDLYAIDTKLGLASADFVAYNGLKLNKFGITVNDYTINADNKFPHLKCLLLKNVSRNVDLRDILPKIELLEELWIINTDETCRFDFYRVIHNIPNLKKYVIKSKATIPLLDFKYFGFDKVYESRKLCNEIIFEKNPSNLNYNFLHSENVVNTPWVIWCDTFCDKPFCPKDYRKLCRREFTLSDIQFESLNFHYCYYVHYCNIRVNKSIWEILNADTSSCIKSLCIQSCLFADSSRSHVEDITSGFKRNRSGIKMNLDDHPFKHLTYKLTELEELEVFFCKCYNYKVYEIIYAYTSIANFEKLKKLTIGIPLFLDGSFLIKVLTNCKQLESLRITSLVHNQKLNIHFCNGLKNAVSLKDLRFETVHMNIDNFFISLNTLENCRLERLFLKLSYVKKFSVDPFEKFLDANPQLIFVFIVIQEFPKTILKKIENSLKVFKAKNPARVLFARKSSDGFTGNFPIPSAHHDMLSCDSNISHIDIYKEF